MKYINMAYVVRNERTNVYMSFFDNGIMLDSFTDHFEKCDNFLQARNRFITSIDRMSFMRFDKKISKGMLGDIDFVFNIHFNKNCKLSSKFDGTISDLKACVESGVYDSFLL